VASPKIFCSTKPDRHDEDGTSANEKRKGRKIKNKTKRKNKKNNIINK
jgi:hypothetical protein